MVGVCWCWCEGECESEVGAFRVCSMCDLSFVWFALLFALSNSSSIGRVLAKLNDDVCSLCDFLGCYYVD